MTPEEKAAHDALMLSIKSQVSEITSADKATIETLKTQLADLKTKAEASKEAAIVAEVAELAATVKGLKESGKSPETKKTLVDQLKENKEKIKAIAAKTSSDEVVIKALTDRSDIANNQQAMDLPDIGQLAHRKLSLYDLFPKINVSESNNNGTIRYYDWDEDTIARAAAAVAEGAAFPESTAKFKKGSITLQKIGDTLPVTEEFFEDEAMFASELNMFLEVNVKLEIDRQLAEGDGTGNQITGLISSSTAYSLPTVGTVTAPTIYDLLIKVAEQITSIGGSKYMPDFAVMNIVDINKMRLAKDQNENYILPPFVSRDGSQVGSILVIESNIIPEGEMVVGDRKFARIYEKGGVVLGKGTVGTQFTEDELTLKARKRMAFLIRTADAGGFRYVSDIDAALTAIDVTNT